MVVLWDATNQDLVISDGQRTEENEIETTFGSGQDHVCTMFCKLFGWMSLYKPHMVAPSKVQRTR